MTQETHEFRTVPRGVDPTKRQAQAVAVRIGERELWLGDGGAASPEHLDIMDLNVEYVVTVNRRKTEATTDFHPLVDGRVNDQDEFNTAIETARQRYRLDGSVLVHCAAGISRSTTVIATTLAAEEDRSFGECVDIVSEYRKRARPHPKLRMNACRFLASELDRDAASERLEELKTRLNPTKMDDFTWHS